MFTNLDAMWLSQLADRLREGDSLEPTDEAAQARLRRIADNLQRMDETNATLSRNQSFEQGYATAMRQLLSRSNIVSNPEGEDEIGDQIIGQIDRFVAEGKVRRVPLGKRGLEDKPHEFNAPLRKRAKAKPKIDLDLSVLDEL